MGTFSNTPFFTNPSFVQPLVKGVNEWSRQGEADDPRGGDFAWNTKEQLVEGQYSGIYLAVDVLYWDTL